MSFELLPAKVANQRLQAALAELERGMRIPPKRSAGASLLEPMGKVTSPVMSAGTSKPPTKPDDSRVALAKATAADLWPRLTAAERATWPSREFYIDLRAHLILAEQDSHDAATRLAFAEFEAMPAVDKAKWPSAVAYAAHRSAELDGMARTAMSNIVAESTAFRPPPLTPPTVATMAPAGDDKPLNATEAKARATAEWEGMPPADRIRQGGESRYLAFRQAELQGLVNVKAPSPVISSTSFEDWKAANPGPAKLSLVDAKEIARREWIGLSHVDRRKHESMGAFINRRADQLMGGK